MPAVLNGDPLTNSDERNIETRSHLGHTVKALSKPNSRSSRIPGVRVEETRYYCQQCSTMFTAYNWYRDTTVRVTVPPTQHDG